MSKEGTPIIVREACRVSKAQGISVLDAVQKLATAGGECPRRGVRSETDIFAPYGTKAADVEIAAKLPPCDTCGLKARSSDFTYAIPNPSGADNDLPIL